MGKTGFWENPTEVGLVWVSEISTEILFEKKNLRSGCVTQEYTCPIIFASSAVGNNVFLENPHRINPLGRECQSFNTCVAFGFNHLCKFSFGNWLKMSTRILAQFITVPTEWSNKGMASQASCLAELCHRASHRVPGLGGDSLGTNKRCLILEQCPWSALPSIVRFVDKKNIVNTEHQ